MKTFAVVTLAVALSSSAIAAPETGTVTGHMTVNGKTIKFNHVYASARPNARDTTKTDIHVIVSDVAISDADLASSTNRENLATAGKLHAMELILGADPMGHPGKYPLQNDIYDSAFNGSQQPMRLIGTDEFETKTDDGKTIAGRHSMSSPHKFSDIGNGVVFQDDVTFSASITR